MTQYPEKDHEPIKFAMHKNVLTSIEEAVGLIKEFEGKRTKKLVKLKDKPIFICETCEERLRVDDDRFGQPGQFCSKHFEHFRFRKGMNLCSRRDPESKGFQGNDATNARQR